MQQKTGECKECGKFRPINSKDLCGDCQYFLTHGKTRLEVALEKEKLKPRKIYVFKRKPIKTVKKQIKKKTGEREMFEEIWYDRPHYCENENCGKYLGEEPKIQYFSHRRSKGAAPELRLVKSNIDLLCCECHHQYEFGSREGMKLKN